MTEEIIMDGAIAYLGDDSSIDVRVVLGATVVEFKMNGKVHTIDQASQVVGAIADQLRCYELDGEMHDVTVHVDPCPAPEVESPA